MSRPTSNRAPFKARRVEVIEAFEQVYIRELLNRCCWDLGLAARTSRLSRNHLLRLIGKHGLCRRCDGVAQKGAR